VLPHLGRLQIRNGMAGVIFDSNLIEQCLGKTRKEYQNKLWAPNNLMNDRNFDGVLKPPRPPSSGIYGMLKRLDISKIDKGIQRGLKADRGIENKENIGRNVPRYTVPSVSNTFGDSSIEKMLN